MVTPHDIDGVVYTGIKGHEWEPHCWHGFEFTIHARSTRSGRACCMCSATESDGPPEPPAEQSELAL